MKYFLTVTSVVEALAGIFFLLAPATFISLLLGTSVVDPGSLIVARLAGIALIAMAFACWLSRVDLQSTVMVKTMVMYNIGCVLLLTYAVLYERISGQGLWPAVLVHLTMLVWGVRCLWKRRGQL